LAEGGILSFSPGPSKNGINQRFSGQPWQVVGTGIPDRNACRGSSGFERMANAFRQPADRGSQTAMGINRLPDGRIADDVDFGAVSAKASYITPVPGGVGPMTVTMLLDNTIAAAERQTDAGNTLRTAM